MHVRTKFASEPIVTIDELAIPLNTPDSYFRTKRGSTALMRAVNSGTWAWFMREDDGQGVRGGFRRGCVVDWSGRKSRTALCGGTDFVLR